MYPKTECVGKTYGRLTVLSECPKISGEHRKVLCLCRCGNEALVQTSNLFYGSTKSCGCLQREISTTHGKRKTPEYKAWVHMKGRCLNKNDQDYKYYGGRGISICDEWKESVENFIADMGNRPSSNHSIDRIDVNGNYNKDNCKWSTRQEQALNKRNNRLVSYRDEQLPLAEACRRAGINYSTAFSRLWRGKDWAGKAAL